MEANQCAAGAGALIYMIIMFALAIIMLVSWWKVFNKAGEHGWAILIPIYNIIVMLKVADKPLWFIVLFFIPIANLVAAILVLAGISANFGRGTGTTIGLIFLPYIFVPILAFGSAQYGGSIEA